MPTDCLWPVSSYRFYVTKHSLDLHSFLQNNYQLAYQNEWWEAIKQLIQAFHPSVHLLFVEHVVFIFNDETVYCIPHFQFSQSMLACST